MLKVGVLRVENKKGGFNGNWPLHSSLGGSDRHGQGTKVGLCGKIKSSFLGTNGFWNMPPSYSGLSLQTNQDMISLGSF